MSDTTERNDTQYDELISEEASALAEADRYLHGLLDRLFTDEVRKSHEGLHKHVTTTSDDVRDHLKEHVSKDLGRLRYDLTAKLDEARAAADEDRDTATRRHNQVADGLNKLYAEQKKLADEQVPEALERLKELSMELTRRLDILRGELSHGQKRLGAAIHDVRETTEAVGNAVVDVRQAVGDVHEDVRKGHHESRQAIGELAALLDRRATAIDGAVAGLAQETERRAIAAAEETARLRRWVIAATITAALALVAAVLAVIL